MDEHETEVVFTASARQIEGLPVTLRELADSVRARPLRLVEDRYLDTPTRLLMRAGVACRLRRVGRRSTLTLKSLTPLRAGLAERVEVEEALPPDPVKLPGRLPGRALRARLLPLARHIVVDTLFALEQERRVYLVRTREGARLDVSADQVRLAGANGAKVLKRIEIELREGAVRSLLAFASDLRRAMKLEPADGSKFEYGLREAGLEMPAVVSETRLRIRPQDSVRKAAARALTRYRRRMVWHVQGTRLGINPECLHRMRVNVRRLRAVLRLFRDALPSATTSRLAAELKWLGQTLGAVRDLDVHLEACAGMHGRTAGTLSPAAETCRREIYRRRERAYDAMRRDLRSPRFKALDRACRDLVRKLHRPVAAQGGTVAQEGAVLMAAQLGKVLKVGRAVDARSPDGALHDLRVRCKRLRYACETLRDVYGKPVARMGRRLAALQDVLGAHQDAVAAQALIARVIEEGGRSDACSLRTAYVLGECAAAWRAEQRVRRRAFKPAWRAFDDKKARRAFLKALRKRMAG